MRHRAIAAALAAVVTAGCASGPINAPPPITQPSEVATVSIERKWSIVGAPATMFFVINKQRIYGLRNGQRWSFQIDPDEYQFGYDLGFNACRQRVILRPRTRYLLELTPICNIDPRPL